MESRGGHVALLVPLVMVAAGQSRAESRWCATFPSSNNTHNGRIKCEVETDSCFAHFNSGIARIGGCWKNSGAQICKNPTCILSSPNSFCCCRGNMCNINITKAPVITTTSQPTEEPPIQMASAFIILGCVIAAALLFLAVFYLLHMFLARRKEKRREDMEKGDLHKDFSQLQLLQVVGRGCYGNVWMGQLVDQCAAVKQLSLNNRQNFLNERDIYRLPMMEHENIARFIDATERQLPGKAPELLIILEYYPLGSLNNFLKHKSCNWPEACRMAHSITRGLSYLHTERWHSGLYKPAIAHRDLNGRNVLVHSDGTCAISDFGMAMALSRPFSRPLEEETAAIAEVGTYRYMAPEVLDGAINLSDHQTALKQVDVYALGLMYWELFSRCSDIFSGHVAPPFSLAFEAELGSHPTFDEMQQLVARERHRPVFPASWQDDPLLNINPLSLRCQSCGPQRALVYLKLVIEECWEQDAEARLTACCAEERMKELGELRPLCLSIDNVENTRLIPLQNLEKHLTPVNESSPKDPSLLSKLPMIPDSCHNGHSIADIPVTRSDLRPPQRSSPASRDQPPVSPADILAYIQRKRGELGMTVKGLNEKLHDGVVDGQGKCVHSAGMITNKVPSLCTTH